MQVGIYLTGAMRFTPNEEHHDRGWRDVVTKAMAVYPSKVVIFNPMAGEQVNREGTTLFGKFPLEDNSILQHDLASIARSDIIFMNLLPLMESNYPHIGTLAELGISIAQHKLLIVIANNLVVVEHPFVRAGATRILPTLEDGIEYLQGLVGVLLGSEIKL